MNILLSEYIKLNCNQSFIKSNCIFSDKDVNMFLCESANNKAIVIQKSIVSESCLKTKKILLKLQKILMLEHTFFQFWIPIFVGQFIDGSWIFVYITKCNEIILYKDFLNMEEKNKSTLNFVESLIKNGYFCKSFNSEKFLFCNNILTYPDLDDVNDEIDLITPLNHSLFNISKKKITIQKITHNIQNLTCIEDAKKEYQNICFKEFYIGLMVLLTKNINSKVYECSLTCISSFTQKQHHKILCNSKNDYLIKIKLLKTILNLD